MKELVKVIEKRIFIWSMAVNMVYSIAYYGESFILSYFGTSPLTVDKLVFLAVGFFIVRFAMLITGKLGSYIDSVNYNKNWNSTWTIISKIWKSSIWNSIWYYEIDKSIDILEFNRLINSIWNHKIRITRKFERWNKLRLFLAKTLILKVKLE